MATHSRDQVRYPIPAASAQAWEKHKDLSSQNPGLIFDRFVQDWGWREQQFRDKEAKKKAWEEVVRIAPRADGKLLAAWNARWEQTAAEAHAATFNLKTDWRFLTGLGRKGPLEAGFTFHRYGFPILPGSSVKGVARAWATFELGGEREAEANDDFKAIFGRAPKSGEDQSVAQSGGAIFFDAIPAGKPTLELDVMNPHFPKYYSGEEFPTDWQNPIPVYFLTVAPGTEFRFAVGWRGTLDAALRDKAVKWLKAGLTNLGAGAKTSAGYGYFVVSDGDSPAASGAAQPAVPAAAGPSVKEEAVVKRRGVIVMIDPSKSRRGRVRDEQTGQEYEFSTNAVVGDTPGKKSVVVFDLKGDRVASVRRA